MQHHCPAHGNTHILGLNSAESTFWAWRRCLFQLGFFLDNGEQEWSHWTCTNISEERFQSQDLVLPIQLEDADEGDAELHSERVCVVKETNAPKWQNAMQQRFILFKQGNTKKRLSTTPFSTKGLEKSLCDFTGTIFVQCENPVFYLVPIKPRRDRKSWFTWGVVHGSHVFSAFVLESRDQCFLKYRPAGKYTFLNNKLNNVVTFSTPTDLFWLKLGKMWFMLDNFSSLAFCKLEEKSFDICTNKDTCTVHTIQWLAQQWPRRRGSRVSKAFCSRVPASWRKREQIPFWVETLSSKYPEKHAVRSVTSTQTFQYVFRIKTHKIGTRYFVPVHANSYGWKGPWRKKPFNPFQVPDADGIWSYGAGENWRVVTRIGDPHITRPRAQDTRFGVWVGSMVESTKWGEIWSGVG